MAEAAKKDAKSETGGSLEKEASRKGSLLGWLILFSVVMAGATGGFALSQLIGGTDPAAAETEAAANGEQPTDMFLNAVESGSESWPYEKIEPVVANLDEPGVTRYIRVTVMLEISGDVERVKMEEFLDGKNAIVKDWMTTYFAGLSLEDVRGSRNLSRIKQEIQDQLNEMLFPDGRPFVKRVLFKEFAVQ